MAAFTDSQDRILSAKLQHASAAGFFSVPVDAPGPADMPLRIAISFVALTPGCVPPRNAIGRRVAGGCGATVAEARLKAWVEAAERHSLQYADHRAWCRDPFFTIGGCPEPAEAKELFLGVPGYDVSVTSEGAAAGYSREHAALAAILELIERTTVADFRRGALNYSIVSPDEVSALAELGGWHAARARRLELRVGASPAGCWVAAAISRDADGGRPIEGSAAALDAETALARAAQEAIAGWRNMVSVEHAGTPLSAFTGDDLLRVSRYRGAAPSPDWPPAVPDCISDALRAPNIAADPAALAEGLARNLGRRVRLFDMSDPVVGIDVVRALLG